MERKGRGCRGGAKIVRKRGKDEGEGTEIERGGRSEDGGEG